MASATGPSDARFETTAAWAANETSTAKLQDTVEKNAAEVHEAATDAAKAAQFRAGGAQVAVNELEQGLSEKQPTGEQQSYVQQARDIAGSALATAASYLPNSISGSTTNNTATTNGVTLPNSTNGSVMASVQSAAGTAVETAKSVFTTAQQTVQPHVENAMAAAQPHIDSAVAAAKPHIDNARQTVQPHVDRLTGAVTGNTADSTTATEKPADVQPTTAPLQGSGGVMGGPYSETGKSSMGSNNV